MMIWKILRNNYPFEITNRLVFDSLDDFGSSSISEKKEGPKEYPGKEGLSGSEEVLDLDSLRERRDALKERVKSLRERLDNVSLDGKLLGFQKDVVAANREITCAQELIALADAELSNEKVNSLGSLVEKSEDRIEEMEEKSDDYYEYFGNLSFYSEAVVAALFKNKVELGLARDLSKLGLKAGFNEKGVGDILYQLLIYKVDLSLLKKFFNILILTKTGRKKSNALKEIASNPAYLKNFVNCYDSYATQLKEIGVTGPEIIDFLIRGVNSMHPKGLFAFIMKVKPRTDLSFEDILKLSNADSVGVAGGNDALRALELMDEGFSFSRIAKILYCFQDNFPISSVVYFYRGLKEQGIDMEPIDLRAWLERRVNVDELIKYHKVVEGLGFLTASHVLYGVESSGEYLQKNSPEIKRYMAELNLGEKEAIFLSKTSSKYVYKPENRRLGFNDFKKFADNLIAKGNVVNYKEAATLYELSDMDPERARRIKDSFDFSYLTPVSYGRMRYFSKAKAMFGDMDTIFRISRYAGTLNKLDDLNVISKAWGKDLSKLGRTQLEVAKHILDQKNSDPDMYKLLEASSIDFFAGDESALLAVTSSKKFDAARKLLEEGMDPAMCLLMGEDLEGAFTDLIGIDFDLYEEIWKKFPKIGENYVKIVEMLRSSRYFDSDLKDIAVLSKKYDIDALVAFFKNCEDLSKFSNKEIFRLLAISPNIASASKYADLAGYGLYFADVVSLIRTGAALEEITDYFDAFLGQGFSVKEGLAWFEVEKDKGKALRYVGLLGPLGFDTPLLELYKIEPSGDFLTYQRDFLLRIMKEQGCSELMAVSVLLGFKHRLLKKDDGLSQDQKLKLAVRYNFDLGEFEDFCDRFEELPGQEFELLWGITTNDEEVEDLLKEVEGKKSYWEMIRPQDEAFLARFVHLRNSYENFDLKLVTIFSKKNFLHPQMVKRLADLNDILGDKTKRELAEHFLDTSYHERVRLKNLEGFFAAPEMKFIEKVYHLTGKPEEAIHIGTNLYFSGWDLSELEGLDEEAIESGLEEVEALQEEYESMPTVEGRNIVVVKHGELWSDGSERFFDDKMEADMRKAQENDGSLVFEVVDLGTNKPTPEELEAAKAKALNYLINTPPPLMYLVDAHGSPSSVSLNEGAIDASGSPTPTLGYESISDKELADALTKRAIKFKDRREELSRDIIAIHTCHSKEFAKNVYEEVLGPAPMFFFASETGQYGISHSTHKETRDEAYTVLGIGESGWTVRDAYEAARKHAFSNYGIFGSLPVKKDKEKEKKTKEDKSKKAPLKNIRQISDANGISEDDVTG